MGADLIMDPLLDQLTSHDQVLVALIVKNTQLGQEPVEAVVSEYLAGDPEQRTDLAHFFIERGYLSRTEMFRLVRARNFALLRKEDKRIARRAVRRGFLTRNKVAEALEFQKQLFKALGDIKRLHEIFVDDGSLSKDLAQQLWSEYKEFLGRKGEHQTEARTDPSLMRKPG